MSFGLLDRVGWSMGLIAGDAFWYPILLSKPSPFPCSAPDTRIGSLLPYPKGSWGGVNRPSLILVGLSSSSDKPGTTMVGSSIDIMGSGLSSRSSRLGFSLSSDILRLCFELEASGSASEILAVMDCIEGKSEARCKVGGGRVDGYGKGSAYIG